MSTFSRVYKPYTFKGRGVSVKISIFTVHLTFWSDFYYFHGYFWHSKHVDVYSSGSQKVYGLYTHDNVDIYGP